MSYSVWEKTKSRKLKKASAELQYVVVSTGEASIDSNAAYTAVENEAAATFTLPSGTVLPLSDIELTEEGGVDGLFTWDASVTYGTQDRTTNQATQANYVTRGSTKGGTQHVTQAIKTINRYAATGKTAPDHKGAIGVTANGVQGVDIGTSALTWTEEHIKTNKQFTAKYQAVLRDLTWTVNDAAFRGAAKGEVVLAGVDFERQNDDEWKLTFEFLFARNKSNVKVHNITVKAKEGWHLADIEYAAAEDAAARKMTERPIAVHVHQVYEYGDFSRLGID